MKAHTRKLLIPMMLCSAALFAARADGALIAHYGFNGSLLADSSGNGRTLTNSTSPATSSGTGAAGTSGSVSMNGSSQFLYRDDSAFDFGSGEFAVSLWYRRTDGGQYALIGNGTKESPSTFPNSGFILQVSGTNGSPVLEVFEGNSPSEITTGPLSLSESSAFQHVVFQRNAAGFYELYVNNGSPLTSGSASAVSLNTGLGFGIGGENVDLAGLPVTADLTHNGLIDEVFIFNEALTPAEIDGLFNNNTFPGIGGGGGGPSGGIPEPTSFVMLLLGLVLAAYKRRRAR